MKLIAFLSCSLDTKDKPFVDVVESKLKEFDVFLDGHGEARSGSYQ